MSKHFSDDGEILTVWGHVLVRWSLAKYEARKRRDEALLWAVRLIPRRLRYWTLIDAFAVASTGPYETTHPDDLRWGDVLDRGEARGALISPQTPMRWPWKATS